MSTDSLQGFAINRWPLLPLRLIVGFAFMQHGLAKRLDAFATILQAMGVPGAHFMAWSTILLEILGGLSVMLGLFVTLPSLPMAFSSHVHRAFALWIQLDQAPGGNSGQRKTETQQKLLVLKLDKNSFKKGNTEND